MTRLAIGLALLLLAALLAAVGWVLARPRWRWDSKSLTPVDKSEPRTRPITQADLDDLYDSIPTYWSTGSPESVTSRADNGTGFDPRLMGV